MQNSIVGALLTGFVSGLCLMFLLLATFTTPKTIWQREAVKHGAAEYVLDPATGETTWRWKPQPAATQPSEGGR